MNVNAMRPLLSRSKASIMGVVNATPDSFSDGGDFFNTESAVQHGLNLVKQGADIIDIGGESTRPGSETIDFEEQIARVLPVIEGIRKQDKSLLISVDTTNQQVAEHLLLDYVDAGIALLN